MSEAFERIRVGLDEVRAIMDGRAVPARIEYASAKVMTTPMLKRAWDELTDEIHAELNARGEGEYCAV
jgi:hypothetical protein